MASWTKLARRPPLLFECWSRGGNSCCCSNDNSSKDGRQRCDRDAPHIHSPSSTHHPPKARMEQLAATGQDTAVMQTWSWQEGSPARDSRDLEC